MSRRRKSQYKYFYPVGPAIRDLERRTVAVTVPVTFTMEDVAEWLWGRDLVEFGRKAYGAIECDSESCLSDRSLSFTTAKVDLWLNLDSIKLAKLHPEKADTTNDGAPVEALKQVYQIKKRFDKVRECAAWFHDNEVLPAAVKHFWPTMCVLLPEHQGLQFADGVRFKDPEGISAILPLCRETQEIVAATVFLPKEIPGRENFRVVFGEDDGGIVSYSADKYELL